MSALFATVQLRTAFRARTVKFGARRKSGGTAIAPRRRYRLHQAWETRSGDIDRRTRAGRFGTSSESVRTVIAAGWVACV